MGKKGSPSERFKVRETYAWPSLVQLLSSPGYMLTKLTKKILESNQELKVASTLMLAFKLQHLLFSFPPRKLGRI
jgi:hypothetical protein